MTDERSSPHRSRRPAPRGNEPAARADEPLARLLRDADPAAATTLDAVERARMRQAITAAAERHAGSARWTDTPSAWLKPALAAAALVTAMGLAVWSLNEPGSATDVSNELADAGTTAPADDLPMTPDEATDAAATATGVEAQNRGDLQPQAGDDPAAAGQVAENDPSANVPAASVSAPAGAAPSSPAAGAITPAVIAAPAAAEATVDPGDIAIAAADPSSPPDRPARTVHFTAPRGTRIIWTLDPNFESPIAGAASRQKE